MEALSIFDIFKIGIGPSSSHTLGPWKAAMAFAANIDMLDVDLVQIYLYGSLSKTGLGHATDKALILGLLGYDPVTVDTESIPAIIKDVELTKRIKLKSKSIDFDLTTDLVFENYEHPRHPNTLKFVAIHRTDIIYEEVFVSLGGGFIESNVIPEISLPPIALPNPIERGIDLIKYTNQKSCKISDIVWENELFFKSQAEIDAGIEQLYNAMLDCLFLGCKTEGILPGGLNVRRRAKELSDKLMGSTGFNSRDQWLTELKSMSKDFSFVNMWVSCFALAINEQNAGMNRVVTSPTNGAAGVIPAVLMYYMLFCDFTGMESVKRFFFTAGEIGCLFKKGATISAAVGGCQAEIGVSSSMAAAALTEVLGGTPAQCLMAAEIAMEHHLGLTCDPIGGLVQIPCIERNAMGAMKAITAANLALMSDSDKAIVNLDMVIKTMWDTARDMNHKYKETAEGGLALNVAVNNPNC